MKMKKKGKTTLSARLTALCMAVLMAVSLLPSTASRSRVYDRQLCHGDRHRIRTAEV